jgi:UDP-3-O-[3-hydroxymyristoyl] glucosamine N-acyltransferase
VPMLTHNEICELLGLVAKGDSRAFARVTGFNDAGPNDIVFAEDAAALRGATESGAGLILVPPSLGEGDSSRVLAVRNPKYAFALVGQRLHPRPIGGIHASAVVEHGAQVGDETTVGAGSVVEDGAVIGTQCSIGHHVIVHGGVRVGDRCIVQANTVLGSTGFGYVTGPDGRHIRFPQQGTLWIGDDVEIGAGCTIDRGALGETRIGRGSKIDNLVHIGHNVRIGQNVIVAAQTGISGSSVVEDGAILGGQVGMGEHATVGPGVILGGGAGVLTGKKLRGPGQVFWGRPAQPLKQYLRDLARLRRGNS